LLQLGVVRGRVRHEPAVTHDLDVVSDRCGDVHPPLDQEHGQTSSPQLLEDFEHPFNEQWRQAVRRLEPAISAVALEQTTWPPWATAMRRAALLTTGPK